MEVCLHSVFRALNGIPSEVIVVDNDSKDNSIAMLKEKFPDVKLIENKVNTGFSKANNQAYALAKGQYVLFLNPDTVVEEDFFIKSLDYLDKNPDVGAIGPRLIDGKGVFAPDGKKSYPSLSVAIFKTTGINKIFSKSPYFNAYYAVHVGERQVAPVDALSGCCMFTRKEAVDKSGGAFDEAYFMYCEDIDLSYRLNKSGYKNVYFPEVDVIHYKGESTKKASLNYVRIFNQALKTFVKKHYNAAQQKTFLAFIDLGLIMRAAINILKTLIKQLSMPIIDTIILACLFILVHNFWITQVKDIAEIPFKTLAIITPSFVLIWMISNYLNGVYDKPYRALRVIRGMAIGTLVCFAFYGLLDASMRHSRAIILFTGMLGAVCLVGIHEMLFRLGILKTPRYNRVPKKAVIVGDIDAYQQAKKVLEKVSYAPELMGRIAIEKDNQPSLGLVSELKNTVGALGINEVIFCVDKMSYKQMFQNMNECGPEYEYKIHLPLSSGFVGSNSSGTSGDLYTIDKRFKIVDFAQQRNKRVFDLVMSFCLILIFPFWIFKTKSPTKGFNNLVAVFLGRKTMVGYTSEFYHKMHIKGLPKIKSGIVPTVICQEGFVPDYNVIVLQDTWYAHHYAVGVDWVYVLKNIKFVDS